MQFSVAVSLFPVPAACLDRLGPARLEQLGHQARPAGLVRRSDAPARVAVEILVEQDVVPEMGVAVQLRVVGVDRPPALIVFPKNAGQPPREFVRHLFDRDEAPRARRALDLEVIAVVVVELL